MYCIYIIISRRVSVIKLSGCALNHDDRLCLLTSHLLKSWRTTRRRQCLLPAATRWSSGKNTPRLSSVMSATARRVLCISAGSAQSERDFSSVGRAVTDMRSRINEDTVEAIKVMRWESAQD